MKRCLNCMEEKQEELTVCPHCGYDEDTTEERFDQLKPGSLLNGRFTVGRPLGRGGFGITYIAWDNSLQRKVAIKEYLPKGMATRESGNTTVSYDPESKEFFLHGVEKTLEESRKLAGFSGLESVTTVYDCFRENGTAYIVMEILKGENVKEKINREGRMTFEETLRVARPVLKTLAEVHKTGIIHRDISPDNIFMCDDGKVKLLDFGSARIAEDDEKSKSIVLKHGYAPPEQYSSRGRQGAYTDIYAMCATLYKMLTGTTPVDSLERIAGEDELRDIRELVKIPAPAAEAIMKGMAVNSADRIQSADELLAGLEKEEEEQPDGEETRTLYVPPVKSAPDPAPVPEPAPVPASKPAKIQKTGKAGNKKLIIGIVAAALAVAAAVGGVIWFVMNRNSGPAVPEDKLDLVVRTTDNEVPVGQVFQIDVDLLYKDGYENTEYSWEVFSDKEEIATAAYAGAKQRESASGNYLKTGLISVKGISPGETYIYIEIKNSSEILDVEAFEVVVTEAEETTEEKTTKETTTAEETTAEETTTKLDISALLSAYITTKEADSGVYLRKSANEDAKTPELLKRGTEVKIIEKQGDWYKVAVNGKTGYIKSEYISYKKVYPFSVGYVKGGVYYNDWANIKCSFLDGGNTTGQDNCGGEIGPIMFSTRNSSNDLRVFIGYKKCNINDAVSSNYDTGPYNSVIAGRQCVCYDGRTDEGLLYSRFLRDCYVQVDDYTIIVRLVASDKESLDDLQNMIQKLS